MIELVVTAVAPAERLDRYLAAQLPQFSRATLQRWIRDGFVRLNGEQVRQRETLRASDVISIEEPAVEPAVAKAEDIPLDVLFEDQDLLVINKPAGLVIHAGAGHSEGTLVNALLAHCRALSGIGGKERPGIVHRLDKETSGCIVVAKNDLTHRALSEQFVSRDVEKTYLAIVAGVPRHRSGTIDQPIGRHAVHRQKMAVQPSRGRSARTDYRIIKSSGDASVIQCQLHSGRTHQIRVHLHHIGHSILGDKVYGGSVARKFDRQMLHAWRLAFTHPRTQQRQMFEADVPNDFQEALATLGLRVAR